MKKNVLEVKSISKYYGSKDSITKAIEHIDFTVDEGEFIGVMGPSGSGKTTLLNCISTIDKVTNGDIIINGQDINHIKGEKLAKFRRTELGFIFQDFNLLDTLTIFENIALALTIDKVSPSKIKQRVMEVAKALDIVDCLQKYPYQASGGQKQRAAAARALVNNPTLILADEPTGALDSKSSRMLLDSMQGLNEQLNATILMVTHDAFSASYANRILFIKDGKVFNEIRKGNDTRKVFFDKIMDVVALLGGDVANVR